MIQVKHLSYHLKQVRKVTNLAQSEDSAEKRVIGKDGKSYPARKTVSKKVSDADLEPEKIKPSLSQPVNEKHPQSDQIHLSELPTSEQSFTKQPHKNVLTCCSPLEFTRDVIAFHPGWFIDSVLRILLEEKQSRDRQTKLKEPPFTKYTDNLIYGLFCKLDNQDRKETFISLFDKILTTNPECILEITKSMESKIQKKNAEQTQ